MEKESWRDVKITEGRIEGVFDRVNRLAILEKAFRGGMIKEPVDEELAESLQGLCKDVMNDCVEFNNVFHNIK